MSVFLSTQFGKWAGILVAVLAGAVAQTLMKMGTRQVGPFGEDPVVPYLIRLLFSPFVVAAILTYGLGVVSYMLMLSRLELSFLYPVMTALGLTMAVAVSIALFGEQVSLLRFGGILLMVLGVFLVSRSS